MKKNLLNITLKWRLAILTVLSVLVGHVTFAQKIDSSRISLRPKIRVINNIPQIKANLDPYRPSFYNYYPVVSSALAPKSKEKNGKTLTILKIYPIPVVEQLNISLRLEKEVNLSIKITDLLGNEIVTLINEKTPYGEQTKTFNMPAKLTSGIYFLKIVAGGEPVIKRISVL